MTLAGSGLGISRINIVSIVLILEHCAVYISWDLWTVLTWVFFGSLFVCLSVSTFLSVWFLKLNTTWIKWSSQLWIICIIDQVNLQKEIVSPNLSSEWNICGKIVLQQVNTLQLFHLKCTKYITFLFYKINLEVLNIYLFNFSSRFCSTVFLKIRTDGPGKLVSNMFFQMTVANINWILVEIKSLDCLLKVQEKCFPRQREF